MCKFLPKSHYTIFVATQVFLWSNLATKVTRNNFLEYFLDLLGFESDKPDNRKEPQIGFRNKKVY